jgi:SAM-dependent methyltransferase
MRADGATTVRIVDAGCGPGTWLRRLVTAAVALGFSNISVRGFDIAETQIQTARKYSANLLDLPGVSIRFEVGDLTQPLKEEDQSVDILLSLYSVISHLPFDSLPMIAAEFGRVTKGHFITTVRSVGSQPTLFIDKIEKARHFNFDHKTDRYDIEFASGRRISFNAHLFSARELRDGFRNYFDIEDLCGLDIFHSRFVADQRWNPPSVVQDPFLPGALAKLEEAYARNPAVMERATHLLLVGRPTRVLRSFAD